MARPFQSSCRFFLSEDSTGIPYYIHPQLFINLNFRPFKSMFLLILYNLLMNITVSDSWLGKKKKMGLLIVIRICDGKTISLPMNKKNITKEETKLNSISLIICCPIEFYFSFFFLILRKLFTIIYFSSLSVFLRRCYEEDLLSRI